MFYKCQPELVLASTSPHRRALLERLGLRFEAVSPDVDETRRKAEAPRALVTRLARAKADAVAARYPASWVVGGDQIAILADPTDPADPADPAHAVTALDSATATILGKPGTAERCVDQLLACAGRTLSFLTAVALVNTEADAAVELLDTTRVRFRGLDRAAIERYVAIDAPLDCAGGFKAERLGIVLFERIESEDPTALIGLPLIRLAAALRDAGFELP